MPDRAEVRINTALFSAETAAKQVLANLQAEDYLGRPRSTSAVPGDEDKITNSSARGQPARGERAHRARPSRSTTPPLDRLSPQPLPPLARHRWGACS